MHVLTPAESFVASNGKTQLRNRAVSRVEIVILA